MSSQDNTQPVGSGSDLPTGVLIAAVVCSAVSTVISLVCICLQLRNYRKVALQRWVVRILLMSVPLSASCFRFEQSYRVPIYSVSSCVSLFSLEAAFFIDLVRDL